MEHRVSIPNSKDNIVLSWSNLEYEIPINKKQTRKLISNVSGYIHSGEMVAIMGGSGAGKSTLLNLLAGRVGSQGTIRGDILVNGKERNADNWRKLCAYVEQDDLMFTNLTVTETLTFSAQLRLSSDISLSEKNVLVDKLIRQLGLNNCRDTYIGSTESRGISGGERKRVSVGIELITDPKILFLDEPTSGLDAFNAFNTIQTLKQLANSENKLILMTIHQPRTDILEQFDKIILLSDGKLVWYGKTEDALNHFSKLGYPLPDKTNPSDFFLDIITVDQRSEELKEKSLARLQIFWDAWEKLGSNLVSSNWDHYKDMTSGGPQKQWPTSLPVEFSTLLRRNMLDVIRDKATLGASIGQAVFNVILLGFIFWRLDFSSGSVNNRVAFLFFICINNTFGNVMPLLAIFPLQRQIIKRERAAGSYRSGTAFVSKVISSIPLPFIGNLFFALIVYWMVNLNNDLDRYAIFLLINLVHVWAAIALGLMVGSFVPTIRVGQIVAPLIITVFLLFGGGLINLDRIPQALNWLQWLSIIAYSNKALAQNEFRGVKLDCTGSTIACFQNGDDILKFFGYDFPSMWYSILINACIGLGFLIIGYLGFRKTSEGLMRLK